MCGKTQDLKRLCNIILSKFFTLFLILCYFSNAVVTPLKSNFFQRSLLQCGFIFVSLIKKKKKKKILFTPQCMYANQFSLVSCVCAWTCECVGNCQVGQLFQTQAHNTDEEDNLDNSSSVLFLYSCVITRPFSTLYVKCIISAFVQWVHFAKHLTGLCETRTFVTFGWYLTVYIL